MIHWSDNTVLLSLSRLIYIAFIALGTNFGMLTASHQLSDNSKDSHETHLSRPLNCNCSLCVLFLVSH